MSFFDLLMPPRCVVRGCARRGTWFCERCAEDIEQPGPACCTRCLDAEADPLTLLCARCAEGTPAFERVYAAGLYEPPLRDLVHALKYRRVRPVALELAALISIALPPLDRSVVVVPVPSHRRRVRSRGIDPARLIASRLADRRALKYEPKAIVRTRNTPPQVMRDNASRSENVRAAFRDENRVHGCRVLLVDDVFTTGATSNACALALREGGATDVIVVVAARATSTQRHGRTDPRGL